MATLGSDTIIIQGVGNLSPYSYFGVMSHDPPYVTIGTCATSGRPNRMKDSQQNILETGRVFQPSLICLLYPIIETELCAGLYTVRGCTVVGIVS